MVSSLVTEALGTDDRSADASAPSTSHALANANHEEKGAVQLQQAAPPTTADLHSADPHGYSGEPPITDLGWNEPPEKIPDPLVGGVSNADLWTLIRRFDKQIQHVRVSNAPLTSDLDLNVSKDEAFSPDRLRGNLERLYMTVIVGMMSFIKQIARLRSWEEKRRTVYFCIAYFAAWSVDMLGPLLVTTLMILIGYPPARTLLFPPAPLAMVDSKTGEMKKPKSGALASESMTGAAEEQPGMAVEEEAHNFIVSIGAVGLSATAGKSKRDQEKSDVDDEKMPDPTATAMKAIDAKDISDGRHSHTKKTTKKPVEDAVWEKARPTMQAIGTIADVWERMANSLSPTSPFSRRTPLRLAATLIPVLLGTFFITPYMVVKSTSFLIGVLFFSDPYLQKGITWLNTNYPNWPQYIDIQNTLLKGVPTNAQLALTLLRVGEAHHAPLPPPATSHAKAAITAQHAERTEATGSATPAPPDAITPEHPEHPAHESNNQKSKFPQKLLSMFKITTKAGVNTALHTDHAKAKITGSLASKNRLGAVAEKPLAEQPQGPKTFAARYEGTKGHAMILEPPVNSFQEVGELARRAGVYELGPVLRWESENGKQAWEIPVNDILEIEKLGGFGWKGKVVVGWSLEKEVVDGLRLVYKTPVRDATGEKVGERLREEKSIMAVVGREEIVNRLLSLGQQRWECC